MKKINLRLDDLLVKKGMAKSKSFAQSLIMSGKVLVENKISDKPGRSVLLDSKIELKTPLYPWVSRGGVKLDYALNVFNISPLDLVTLDLGSSTGGFSHVLKERGAKKIFAVDVGYGQFDLSLRKESNIILLERTNARYLTIKHISEKIDLVVCDVSFISLKKILVSPLDLTSNKAQLVALIKPQFEVGKKEVSRGGIVRDESVRKKCCTEIHNWLESKMNWKVMNVIESPIKGAKGNIEYFIYAKK